MKKLQLYKCGYCDGTGTKKEITSHEIICPKAIEVKKEESKKYRVSNNLKNSLRLKAESFDHFADLLSSWAKSSKNEDISVSFTCMSYNECSSNSHSAPIGGVTNWTRGKDSCDQNKPLGYPGFAGNIEMEKRSNGTYCGDIFAGVPGLRTGTGGGGYKARYNVTLFLSDFPEIEKKCKKWLMLKNKKNIKEMEGEKRFEEFLYRQESTRLEDDKLIELREVREDILNKINERTKVVNKESELKFKDMLVVPKTFDFDESKLEELGEIFRR